MACNISCPTATVLLGITVSTLLAAHACRVVAGVLGENLVLPDFITKVSTLPSLAREKSLQALEQLHALWVRLQGRFWQAALLAVIAVRAESKLIWGSEPKCP